MFDGGTLVCSSLANAIPRVLELVMMKGQPVYVRGELNHEVLAADVAITDPRNRLPIVPGRRQITAFCIIEFIWYCAQRADLDPLKACAPNISFFYGGIGSVTGSNYGRQIFGRRSGGSQWDKLVTLLRHDPGSKRAFISIYDACQVSTLLPDNSDVSCTVGFQILVRNGQLHWVTSMRANDAYRGFVSDTFSFTMFQELLASTLEMPIGQYLHRPNSLHTFPEDEPAIRSVLSACQQDQTYEQLLPRMPPLRHNQFWRNLADFWTLHDNCRLTGDWAALSSLREFDDDWWRWVASVLIEFHDSQ
jgi:thymidylate synthase